MKVRTSKKGLRVRSKVRAGLQVNMARAEQLKLNIRTGVKKGIFVFRFL
jgi:hypothetical protein